MKYIRQRQLPHDFTYMWNPENKVNTQNRNRHTDTQNRLIVATWEGSEGGWVKKVKGLRSTDWQLQNSHRGMWYSMGAIFNNTVVTMHGAMWV